MMVNLSINYFPKGTSTLAMQSNGPLPQVCFWGLSVVPFKKLFCAGLHPVHCGLPYIYFDNTKWSGCFMMGNIIYAIQWVWL
jgi:hypothetical protein